MKNKKIRFYFILLLLSGLLSCFAMGFILSYTYGLNHYTLLSGLMEHIVKQYPDSKESLISYIKDNSLHKKEYKEENSSILSDYGYTPNFFASEYMGEAFLFIFLLFLLLFIGLYFLFMRMKKAYQIRILELTNYLEQVNRGHKTDLLIPGEDDFSLLEDEIYKTITELLKTRETALMEHKNLADNLADISHQIKTPVSGISLMTQLLEGEQNLTYIRQIKKQTAHLEHLVEVLLTLSRIDSGALRFEKNKVYIYTLLQLCLETLEPIIQSKNIQITLPNHSEIFYIGDLDWSMEAFLNLIKNSTEHIPEGGLIKIEYTQNPLYTEIQIEDNGTGFLPKELPHIFERFYRGENSKESGAGIGLALAKALIEKQNGIISASNVPGGGACFFIRFYCHQDVTFL